MTMTRTHTTVDPCADCGHGAEYHRHDDDLLTEDCHGPDGNYQCDHFRCLWPWRPVDYAPSPECGCTNFRADPECGEEL